MIYDIISLVVLILALIFASISDFKKREVPNWLTFSLITVGVFFSIFRSISENNLNFFLISLISLGIFFLFGNLMYYSSQWGGGDVKLLMGFAALMPVYPKALLLMFNPVLNFSFLFILIVNVFIIGSLYGVLYMMYLMIKNQRKFLAQFNQDMKKQNLSYFLVFIGLVLVVSLITLPILISILITLAAVLVILLYFSMKSLEKIIMIKEVKAKNLVEGDWVLSELKYKDKVIYKPEPQGITKAKLEMLKEKHPNLKVLVKDGLPFVPGIALAIIVTLIYGNIIALILA